MEHGVAPTDAGSITLEGDEVLRGTLGLLHAKVLKFAFRLSLGIVGAKVCLQLFEEQVEVREPGQRYSETGERGLKVHESWILQEGEGERDLRLPHPDLARPEVDLQLDDKCLELIRVGPVKDIGLADLRLRRLQRVPVVPDSVREVDESHREVW